MPENMRRDRAAEKISAWRFFTWNDYQARCILRARHVELGLARDVIASSRQPADWVSRKSPATPSAPCRSASIRRAHEEAAYLLSYGEARLVFAETKSR